MSIARTLKEGEVLNLTRYQGDEIVLCLPDGSEVRLHILEVISRRGDGRVRLGITAPQEVRIWRKEIYDVLSPENRRAPR